MMSDESASAVVLEFDGVSIDTPPARCSAARDVALRLGAGEMAIVKTGRNFPYSALIPAAEGLLEVEAGEVRFEGEPWSDRAALRDGRRRGRIGRVFSGCGWLSNLNVMENVTLPQRHHTSRPNREIEVEADKMAKRFGIAGVPDGRPSFVSESVLRRAEWVRALLGEPHLLLLESPMRGVDASHLEKLVEVVGEARSHGAAVLWVTDDAEEAGSAFGESVQRFTMRGESLTGGGATG